MTKQKMIETIQQREAELWLKMKEYTWNNAPLNDGYDAFKIWEDEDQYLSCLRFEWCGVLELMETLGLEPNWDLEEHIEASEILSDIWRKTHNEEIA